ncbi:MAG TPA: hypothetical protein VE753_01305 [Gaiellaceae bacterium]|nr:hypothetical protein [Gaiellaceae bacterium]
MGRLRLALAAALLLLVATLLAAFAAGRAAPSRSARPLQVGPCST